MATPPERGRRLAELLPQGRLIEILDSYTLISEDQPDELAHIICEFVGDTPMTLLPPGERIRPDEGRVGKVRIDPDTHWFACEGST